MLFYVVILLHYRNSIVKSHLFPIFSAFKCQSGALFKAATKLDRYLAIVLWGSLDLQWFVIKHYYFILYYYFKEIAMLHEQWVLFCYSNNTAK